MSKIHTETRTRTTASSPRQHRPRARQQTVHPAAIIQRAKVSPESLSAADVMQLQRTIGNRAVGRLLAETVSRQAPVQRQDVGFWLDDETAGRIDRARGGGQPLDGALQAQMGEAMGHDFSRVRVHTDAEADALNQQLTAKAFTTGQDIFFNRGGYDPATGTGRELIAHELSHVVQQSTGRVPGNRGRMTVLPSGDAFEQEADALARKAVSAGYALATHPDGEGFQRRAAEKAPVPGARSMSVRLQEPQLRGRDGAGGHLRVLQRNVTTTHAKGPKVYGGERGDQWGLTDTQSVEVIKAIAMKDTTNKPNTWGLEVSHLKGLGSLEYGLVQDCKEVTGLGGGGDGRTTDENWNDQVTDLDRIASDPKGQKELPPFRWYMKNAVRSHEEVHWAGMGKALKNASNDMAKRIEKVRVNDEQGWTNNKAYKAIVAQVDYTTALKDARKIWDDLYMKEIEYDHNNLCEAAEHKIVDPMINKIKQKYAH